MKRQRRESGQGSKKCVMRRALDGCHGEQRSGVVTVVGAAAAFKPMASHSPATTHPTTTFLLHLRALAQDVLNSSKAITELIDYASKKFLTSLTQSAWEEECELIVTILYLTIAVSKQRNLLFVKGVLVEFFGRWIEDAGGLEFPDILKIVKCEWKCTAFSTLLLLHANLFPDECDLATLEESLTWKSGWFKKKPPLWLLNSTACTDILKVNSLLMKSAMVLGGKVIDLESEDTYIGSTEKFLYANQLYKKGEFKASIECLHSISSQNCGADLQGWILWLTGLGLIKLGKSHTALLKLQAAVDKCQKCIPAIFNIAQIFSDMGLCTAELETLSLLKCSLEERDAFAPMNLQSSILELHHTPPSDLSLRTLCILASRCLQLKMYSEAIEKFTALLEKLEKHHEVMVTCSKTLLKSEDSVPELPAFECILVLAAVAHISNNESENALKVLSKFRETA
ncbi:uncharacterized protein LOC121863831 isoform X2 [Homarus americanus]|nr:uncharacterized protein LOC121863831 isoform X2 [Homarus americanus]